jgi:hypothetical protein
MASNINASIPATGGSLSSTPIRNNFATAKSEIEALQSSMLSQNAPARFGSVNNYVDIDSAGNLTFHGTATYWADLIGGIAAAVTSGPGVSLSNTEHSLAYVAAANTADYAWLVFQLDHSWKAGSTILPHIHWEQDQNNTPNWLIQYRWQRQGQTKTTVWSNYKCNTNAIVWSSGTLNQISYGAGIVPPANYGMSDIIQVRLVRDSTNTSTVFAGADPNNATCSVTAFDIHIECDAVGSNTEFVK